MKMKSSFGILVIVLSSLLPLRAQEKPKPLTEDDYYKILRFDFPPGEVIECGALDFMPDGRLAVGTRRGEIWLVENALADDPHQAKWSRFASGLHEVLGLAAKDDWLYVTQRCDLSRIKDSKGKGRADTFEVVNDEWGINGDYHEYAFGSRPDKKGNIWIVLCLTGSFTSDSKFRGWCLRITPEGKMIPTCSGIRSPGGIAMNAEGDMFYSDNQGPWHGACALKHLIPGKFMGHPGGFKWYSLAMGDMGPAPQEPKSGSRIMIEAKKIPELEPPAIQFPYGKMGQSASGIDCDISDGKFGPFEKQLFVGDQTHSTIMRVYLEKVQGHNQGACFMFRQGLTCGVVPVRFAKDGSLFAGETNRGWGSRGSKSFGLDRMVWTGKVPFEYHEMHARPDGFELTFTQPVDADKAADPKSYSVRTYTYIYRSEYGSPEVDETRPMVTKVEVGKDRKSVRIYLSKMEEGHIHEVKAAGIRSADGLPLLHDEAHYTLNYIPSK
jgi:hypothetical protein